MPPSEKFTKGSESILFVRNYVRPKIYLDLLTDTFGSDWLDWEPETLKAEITRVFGVHPTDQVFEKIMALQTFMKTDLFWDAVMPFEDMILAFGDRYVDPDLLQGCTPEELAYGLAVANELGRSEGKTFTNDIVEYIRACHSQAGVLVYHPILKFAQPAYSGPLKELADRVEHAIKTGGAPPDPIDLDDPYQVQLAKTLDVSAYLDERLIRGIMPEEVVPSSQGSA